MCEKWSKWYRQCRIYLCKKWKLATHTHYFRPRSSCRSGTRSVVLACLIVWLLPARFKPWTRTHLPLPKNIEKSHNALSDFSNFGSPERVISNDVLQGYYLLPVPVELTHWQRYSEKKGGSALQHTLSSKILSRPWTSLALLVPSSPPQCVHYLWPKIVHL